MNAQNEEILTGGNSSNVVKIGNTVHRDQKPQSPFIHKLLQHLEKVGFDEAPKFLGIDNNDREILTYLDGEDGNYPLKPYMMSDEVMIEAAQLLRKYHDSTLGFIIPEGTIFGQEVKGEHEVICHNDFAPYNCVFKDNHLVGIIDFDIAAPGTRLWDLAYAIYRFVPLTNEEHTRESGWEIAPDRDRRLLLFCDAYGLDKESRLQMIDEVIRRLSYMIEYMTSHSLNLQHVEIYQRDVAYIQDNRDTFTKALTEVK
jgi:hypothetical protein